MTDEAELRARIEAQAAARPPVPPNRPSPRDPTNGPAPAVRRPLEPARPWERRLGAAQPSAAPSGGGPDDGDPPTPIAPSNPGIVLENLARTRPRPGQARPGFAAARGTEWTAERERILSFARRHAAADALLARERKGDARPSTEPATDTAPPDAAGALADPDNRPDSDSEADPEGDHRAARAARWLFARRPEPGPVPPAAVATPAPRPRPGRRSAGAEPIPVPIPMPIPRPKPEPVPTPGTAPSPPDPVATPVVDRPRPRGEGSTPADPVAGARPRPSPTTASNPHAATPTIASAPPSALAAAASSSFGRDYDPDLSRFLEASEPQPGDDEKEPPEPGPLKRLWARRRPGLFRLTLKLIVVAVIAVVVALLLRAYVVAPYYIPSASMETTLHGCPNCDDDRILVDKVTYRFHDPRRSDVVVFDRPKDIAVSEQVLVKRVIGVPGDKVQMRNGVVFIDGAKLDEPYLNMNHACYRAPVSTFATRIVAKDQYLVLGDNRCDSSDSRVFGTITKSSIIGRAWLIFWPLKRIGSV
ncbi:MAG: signal peptidase I [Jatrophihabitans sp.]